MRPKKKDSEKNVNLTASITPLQMHFVSHLAQTKFHGSKSKAVQAIIDQAMDIDMTGLSEPNEVNELGAPYGESMQLRLDRIENKLNNAVNEGAVLNAIAGTQEMSRDEIADLFFDGFMQRLGRVVKADSNAEKTTNKK